MSATLKNRPQVPPAELEDLIRSIPEIDDVAVIGVSDRKSGEVPRAYVVPMKDAKVTANDIHEFVNNHVSHSKCRM
jgi:fatty-acyl-CoA synthase